MKIPVQTEIKIPVLTQGKIQNCLCLRQNGPETSVMSQIKLLSCHVFEKFVKVLVDFQQKVP